MLYCIVTSRQHVAKYPNFLLYWSNNCLERLCSLGSSINDVTRFWRKIDPNPCLVTFRNKNLTPFRKLRHKLIISPPNNQKMNCLYKVVSTT